MQLGAAMALARPRVGTGIGSQPRNALGCGRANGTADIEVVISGPALRTLRTDTDRAREGMGPLSLENPGAKFAACGNTQVNSRAEGHVSDPEGS